MASKWDLQSPGEMIFGLGDLNTYVGRQIDRFESVLGGCRIGKRNDEKRTLKVMLKVKNIERVL